MAINTDPSPVIADITQFDQKSGSFLEGLLFNHRPVILLMCLLATLFFGFSATQTKLNASFEKMIPTHQAFIVNFINHYDVLQSQGNASPCWRRSTTRSSCCRASTEAI